MSESLQIALAGVPTQLREKLIQAYLGTKRSLLESRIDSAGLSAGKLCEVAIRLLQLRARGTYTPFGSKISNFADECRAIVSGPKASTITESEKLVIPRALVFMYTMRNTRGIGHVGGDVDANVIDGAVLGTLADWIICEFIRVHHGMSLEDAQDLIDALAIRRLPEIWDVNGKKRVLKRGLLARDEALLLLYSVKESVVLTEDLIGWVEYSNPRVFKAKILKKLHDDRLVEWDRDSDTVTLSPTGALDVESRLLT